MEVFEKSRQVDGASPATLYAARAALADVWVAQGKLEEARGLFDTPFQAAEFEVEEWYQTDSSHQEIATDEAAIVVFWEPWCPFSKAYVPEMQELYDAYPDRDVQIVGLTSLSRNTTEDQALQFIENNGLTFANAKTTGTAFRELGFTGNPAAVAIKNGHVVFKGHPNLITPAFIDGLSGKSVRD